jgi:LysM repeat protein
MDWQALLHNKVFLVGAAASTSTDSAAEGGSLSSSFPNTAGTDVATWLGNQEGTLASQNADFLAQLKASLDALKVVPSPGTAHHLPLTPALPGDVIRTPPSDVTLTGRPTSPLLRYVPVAKYTKTNTAWNSTLSGIAKHENTTVAALMRLNPTITNANLIRTGSQVRVS